MIAGLALAKTPPTVGTADNSSVGKTILVNSHRLTVYELSPETSHHLLCTKANGCFKFWPPATVPSGKTKLTKGNGVMGKLGILHRNGLFQLTLAGRPLYRFLGDAGKPGSANGQGLHSFGGRWHVVVESSHRATTAPSPSPTPIPTTPQPY